MELKQPYVRRVSGFTLLESMIALVIFSVALLALAGMYMKTLSLSHSSYLRALASIQAIDLEERIRANPQSSLDDYVIDCSGFSSASALDPEDITGSDSTVAALDEEDWCGNTHAVFGGVLQSATVANADPDLTITIQWNERSIDESNDVSVASSTFIYTVRK